MPRYKVIMHYPDGTSKELDKIHDDISMAEAYGESVLICLEQSYISNSKGHLPKDEGTAYYEIIEI